MVCQHDDFRRVVWIIQGDISVRMWVLVGADRPSKEIASRVAFCRLHCQVREGAVFYIEGLAHKVFANISRRQPCNFAHRNLNRLRCLKNCGIEFATVIKRPQILPDRRVKSLFGNGPSIKGALSVGLPCELLRSPTESADIIWLRVARVFDKERYTFEPRKCFANSNLHLTPVLGWILVSIAAVISDCSDDESIEC